MNTKRSLHLRPEWFALLCVQVVATYTAQPKSIQRSLPWTIKSSENDKRAFDGRAGRACAILSPSHGGTLYPSGRGQAGRGLQTK